MGGDVYFSYVQTFLNDVWRSNDEGGSWGLVVAAADWQARRFLCAVATQVSKSPRKRSDAPRNRAQCRRDTERRRPCYGFGLGGRERRLEIA